MSLVLDVNGLSISMAHSLRQTPTCEGVRRASSFFRDSVVPTPYSGKTDGVLSATASRQSNSSGLEVCVPQHAHSSVPVRNSRTLAHHSVLFIDGFTQFPQGWDRGSGPSQGPPRRLRGLHGRRTMTRRKLLRVVRSPRSSA